MKNNKNDEVNLTLFKKDLPNGFIIEGDLAIDTETMGLNLHIDKLCLIQISNGNNHAYLVQFSDDYDCPNLKSLLLEKNRCKIFHFARFDLAAIYQYLNISLENIFCTKVASKLTRTYTEAHSLKELCKEFAGVYLSKQQQLSDWSLSELSREQMEYAARDVLYLHKIRLELQSKLLKQSKSEDTNAIFAFLPTCAKLDLQGWKDLEVLQH